MKTKSIWSKRGTLAALTSLGILGLGCKDTNQRAASTEEQAAPNPLESLVNKLEVVSVESDVWLLDFSGVIGKAHQFRFQYKPFDGPVEQNRIPASKGIAVGDTFFSENPGKGRFKLLNIETREEDGQFGRRLRHGATIEDQSEHKKGKTYELKYQLKKAERPTQTQFDHTVTFKLDEKNPFKVEENSTFSLPPGGKEKPFRFVKVTLAEPFSAPLKALSVTVEYTVDGEMRSREIPVP